jgi:lipopolysaccharide/colanic/teichoic acid biosynthesis glycosyltransferase
MMATGHQIAALPGIDAEAAGVRARRCLDILVAAIGLLCLALVMAMVVLAIYLESGRPIFFAQTRLGHRGRHFRLLKFRKFHERPGQVGMAVTVRGDPRLTRVGRFLERTKLDELPQLWNLLQGDMSLVGPRPEALHFADCFEGAYRKVLDYKPGIFGPCQAIFRNEGCLYESGCHPEQYYRNVLFPMKARIDLAYFPHRGMLRDIGWVLTGVLAVFGLSSLSRKDVGSIGEIEIWLRERFQGPQGGLAVQGRN